MRDALAGAHVHLEPGPSGQVKITAHRDGASVSVVVRSIEYGLVLLRSRLDIARLRRLEREAL